MKKLVLYGVGEYGEKVYYNISRTENIEFCIDRHAGRTFHGKVVYSLEEKKEELKDCFIVIAVEGNACKEIKNNLRNIGLEEYRHFVEWRAFNKKLMIIYGNCHCAALREYFNSNPYFQKEYYLLWQNVLEDVLPDCIWKSCNLLVTQDIRKDNSLNMPSADEAEKMVNDGCIKIRIPNLYASHALFPQLKSDRSAEENLNRHIGMDRVDMEHIADKRTIKTIYRFMSSPDSYIDKMHNSGACIQEIADGIRNEDIFGNIEDAFASGIDKLRQREESCSVKIAYYIEKNYKNSLMFYDPGHPTNEVICEMGRNILKLLNIPVCETGGRRYIMDNAEVFVYGCVKRALGLKFEQNFIRIFSPQFTLSGRALTLEDYIEQYIVWNYD